MATDKRTMTAAGITRETLEETPARALELLMGIGKTPIARAILAERGYDAAEHKRGWDLLSAAGNRAEELAFSDDDVSSAVAELDQWDEGGIRLIRAAFTRHPAQSQFVLAGISPATGIGAVTNTGTILGRLDELEATPDGRAALDTLSKRGLPKSERLSLLALVNIAKTGTVPALSAEQLAADDARYESALVDLRAWFDEWAEIGRLYIKRRDVLIRLGLAERRSPGSGNGGDGGGGGGSAGGAPSPSPFLPDPGTK